MTAILTAAVDIEDYVAGDSREIDFLVLQADGMTPFPSLGTCTIAWNLALPTPLGPGALILQKTLGQGVTVTNAGTGAVAVTIAPGDDIPAVGCLLHSLVITTAGNAVYTAAQGNFVVTAAV